MMWQRIWSAWTTLSSSRGLAQMISMFRCGATTSSAAFITGSGSVPVSAMRPAKTEMMDCGPPASARAMVCTWAIVRMAVAFTFTPRPASRATSGAESSPRVLVTGILT